MSGEGKRGGLPLLIGLAAALLFLHWVSFVHFLFFIPAYKFALFPVLFLKRQNHLKTLCNETVCMLSDETVEHLYHNNPKYWDRYVFVNSVDPDQMPQNVASDQSLHCLLYI